VNVPISGIILIPCTLYIFIFTPSKLGQWAVFVTIFQAAAIANIGGGSGFGLMPYFFVVMMISARLLPQWWSGRIRFLRGEPVTGHLRTMVLFISWAVVSAFVLPVLFAGLPVDDPRLGVDRSFFAQMPLHWSFSNCGQAAYMLLNLIFVLHLLHVSETPDYYARLQSAFTWSGICVVAVGAYQIGCAHVGLKFPAWLLNSNAAWGQAYNQWFNGISRLSATFPEPSSAAAFLSAWAMFHLVLVMTGPEKAGWHWTCVVLGTVALIETASTTGYVTVGIMWSAICVSMLMTLVFRGRVNPQALLSVAVMAIGAALALYAMPSAQLILNAVLFGKSGSESSAHRAATIGRSVTVFYRTLFLGAGLGSNRAMSTLFYVLSNLGLPGLVLFLYLLCQLCRRYYKATRFAPNRRLRQFVQASAAGFLAYLVAMVFSGAEITTPLLWVLWGMLLAGIRQSWLFPVADAEQELAEHVASPALSGRVSGPPHYASAMS
jgi:hypothetical protein